MTEPRKDKGGRPPTKTLEPPTRKNSEQIPAGDDSDINEGQEPEQQAKVHDEPKPAKNQPIEKESRSDENSGCGC